MRMICAGKNVNQAQITLDNSEESRCLFFGFAKFPPVELNDFELKLWPVMWQVQ